VRDEDGVLLRKFWSVEAAEKFLQDGYTITVLPKPKKQRKPKIDYVKLFGEPPF
jgi:hypothetical protein